MISLHRNIEIKIGKQNVLCLFITHIDHTNLTTDHLDGDRRRRV